MDTLGQLLRYALVLVLMIVMLGTALLAAVLSRRAAWRISRAWNVIALKVFGVEVVNDSELDPTQMEGGGVIVGLTQQSLLDPTAGYANWHRRVMSVWNIEYALIPFFGWVTVFLGWIIVRQWPAQARRQLEKAAQYAAGGGLVYLSAEGQRSVDGRLNPYKKGPIVLAIDSQTPIYPLYIDGSRDCLPVGEWKIRPGTIRVRYLAPIPTRGLGYEDRNTLLEQLRVVGEAEQARGEE